jgi:hypothetical protein
MRGACERSTIGIEARKQRTWWIVEGVIKFLQEALLV